MSSVSDDFPIAYVFSAMPFQKLLTTSHPSHTNLFCVEIQPFTDKIGFVIYNRVLFRKS